MKTRGDEVDDIDIFDLEDKEGPSKVVEDDDEESEDDFIFEEDPWEVIIRNRINIAKMFLGMDGGYSIRKYKKILHRELKHMEKE